MLHFECDYACGAADAVMRALLETNGEETPGYGEDVHCAAAREMIREKCGTKEIDVHFITGGTQANLTVIAAALKPFEGALCADTGHINVHETGSVEATGHKVLPLPGENGKIRAEQIRQAMESHLSDASFEHMVRPGLVYLSHPTELGTLYTREELEEISAACRDFSLKLFVDGARLCYGLAAEPEVSLPFLCSVCDAFTIGGTKAGLLFGEAIVFPNRGLSRDFRYHLKQRGGMLAKGRLLGVQYEALLRNDEYLALAERANGFAAQLKEVFVSNGCELMCDTFANQIFPIVPDTVLEKLAGKYSWSVWAPSRNGRTPVRFCTSVCTRLEDVAQLLSDLEAAFAAGK